MTQSGSSGLPQFDLRRLVHQAADEFESQGGMSVGPNARDVLINTALPHADKVEGDLRSGVVTERFLKDTIIDVLRNAQDVATEWGRPRIGEDTVGESMRRGCNYFPWC
jgi:hypothetical protein